MIILFNIQYISINEPKSRNAFFQGVGKNTQILTKLLNVPVTKLKKYWPKRRYCINGYNWDSPSRVLPNSNRKMLISIVNPNHPLLGYNENLGENDFLKWLDSNLNSKFIKFS